MCQLLNYTQEKGNLFMMSILFDHYNQENFFHSNDTQNDLSGIH